VISAILFKEKEKPLNWSSEAGKEIILYSYINIRVTFHAFSWKVFLYVAAYAGYRPHT
jgi:hypothetical protein